MRILVIDDSDDKRERVVAGLGFYLSHYKDLWLGEARNYDEAVEALRDGFYDLVVLDLLLPAAGSGPSKETSRSLIAQVTEGERLIPPTYIIGLTQYPEIAESERAFYDENLLSLEFYTTTDDVWCRRIVSKIKYLQRAKSAALHFQSSSAGLDIVVLTVRHEGEFRAVKKRIFVDVESTSHPLWRGELAIGPMKRPNGRPLRVALACIGEMGMAPTAAVAAQAITVFRPRLLAMVGMCCGFSTTLCASPRKLVDVTVVREVSCWEEGKYQGGNSSDRDFLSKGRTRLVDDAIRDKVDLIVEKSEELLGPRLRRIGAWRDVGLLREKYGPEKVGLQPDVKYAPIVSGSSVVADEAVVEEILDRHPGAIGLDMETYGLYVAADRALGRKPSVLSVKGVSDFGEVTKNSEAQKLASTAAAEVFMGIVNELDIFD